MKIAINALSMRDVRHGVGRYVSNVVRECVAQAPQHEFVVYAQESARGALDVLDSSRVTIRSWRRSVALRVAWEHSVLPAQLLRDRVDVFFGPSHVVPVLKTVPQVVSVLDMSWYTTADKHTLAKRVYFRRLIPHCISSADAVIAISESTKKDIVSMTGCAPERISVTPLGVDSRFTPADEATRLEIRSRFDLARPYILHVGVLEPRKNVGGLIRAFAGLVQRATHREHDLVIVGSVDYGWKTSPVYEAVQECGLGDRVKFIGAVRDEDLIALLSAASVFVYPSFYEGFGLPVLEAMACGAPVVTSNNSSMPEVGGDAATYVDPHSVESIETALERVISDEPERAEMAERGVRRAAEFTWAECGRRTLSALEAAASSTCVDAFEERPEARLGGP